jgi:hypothetical protein
VDLIETTLGTSGPSSCREDRMNRITHQLVIYSRGWSVGGEAGERPWLLEGPQVEEASGQGDQPGALGSLGQGEGARPSRGNLWPPSGRENLEKFTNIGDT